MDKNGKKTGGRKAGTPNKTTQELRTWVTGFLSNNRDQIERDFKKLRPVQRIVLFEKLMKYSVPQLQATSLKTDLHDLLKEVKEGGVTEDKLMQLAVLIVEQYKNTTDG